MKKMMPNLNSLTENLLIRLDSQRQRDAIAKANFNQSEAPHEILRRIEYILKVVSLWKHACMADGVIVSAEEFSVSELMSIVLNDNNTLFPDGSVDIDNLFDDMLAAFQNPEPLEDIIQFGKIHPEVAAFFFEQACDIVTSDSVYVTKESEFLNYLGENLGITIEERANIINRKTMFLSN